MVAGKRRVDVAFVLLIMTFMFVTNRNRPEPLRFRPLSPLLLFASTLALACSSELDPIASAGSGPSGASRGDPVDVPLDGASTLQVEAFFHGDELFDLPLHELDGLGPLYTRTACGACHDRGLRGPGSVQKMSVVLADRISPSPDQSELPFGHTVHPLVAAGAKTPVLPPDFPDVLVTLRVGPPILGRGYLEAVDDHEILRLEAEQAARGDAIHGHANRVLYASEPNPDPTFNPHKKGDPVIGRFGLKARIATLDEFTADALQGDMGITSPLRPQELPNPDGLLDDRKPGVDVTAESVNARALYMRLTAIPQRSLSMTTQEQEAGRALFERAHCAVCHAPALRTRADYPIAELANIDAPIFTDLLVHDMGGALADGIIDGQAQSSEWRTAPLIALRFNSTFLHDGRAHSVEQAILLHAGEAADSANSYRALAPTDRAALLHFVEGL